MAEEGAYIRDVHSLEELNNMIEYSGEAMANIEENVSNYIDGVKDVLEKQLNIIRERLEEVKEKLREAEEALSSCEATQEYDEDCGEYKPSCNWERSTVQSAREEVDEWRRKYEEGKRIVSECQSEIDDYNFPGSFLYPPGGHHLILNMRDNQTPKASQQLRDCIDKLQDILNTDVGGESTDFYDNMYIANPEDRPLSADDRLNAFRDNIQGIKREQAMGEVQTANRAMRCPKCGRPIPLCICNNLHGDVHLYK